jgi:hypothetical protein
MNGKHQLVFNINNIHVWGDIRNPIRRDRRRLFINKSIKTDMYISPPECITK